MAHRVKGLGLVLAFVCASDAYHIGGRRALIPHRPLLHVNMPSRCPAPLKANLNLPRCRLELLLANTTGTWTDDRMTAVRAGVVRTLTLQMPILACMTVVRHSLTKLPVEAVWPTFVLLRRAAMPTVPLMAVTAAIGLVTTVPLVLIGLPIALVLLALILMALTGLLTSPAVVVRWARSSSCAHNVLVAFPPAVKAGASAFWRGYVTFASRSITQFREMLLPFMQSSTWPEALAGAQYTIFSTVTGPLAEELVFRGLLQARLQRVADGWSRRKVGDGSGSERSPLAARQARVYWLVSAAFALAHLVTPDAVVRSSGGAPPALGQWLMTLIASMLIYCPLYTRHGLWASVAAHMTWNAATMLLIGDCFVAPLDRWLEAHTVDSRCG